MPFVRPELAVLSGLLFGRQAWLRRDLAASAVDALIAMVVAAPFMVWSFVELGTVLPNTIGAKRAFFAEAWTPGYGFAVSVRAAVIALGPLVVATAIAPRRFGLKWALVIFALAFLGAYGLVLPGSLFWSAGRYPVILLPVGVWALIQTGGRPGNVLAACTVVWGIVTIPLVVNEVGLMVAQERDGIAAGRWLIGHAAPGAPVLVHDAGAITVAGPLNLIDVVGLKTPWAAKIHEAITGPSGGTRREEAQAAIAAKGHARYVVALHDRVGFWPQVATGLAGHGWRVTLVRPRGVPAGYDIYALAPPRSDLSR